MSIRNSYLASLFYQFLDKHILPVLKCYFQNPNYITSFGTVLAAFVPIGFVLHPIMGCIIIIISAVFDVLDGHFARTLGRSSDFGAFWDSSLDRVSDFFYLMGFWILFRHTSHLILATLIFGYGLMSTFMISYIKARAEALNQSCQKGLMDRGIRTLYLIIWSFVLGIASKNDGILWFGLGLYCLLTTITVIERMLEIRSQFFPERHPIQKSSKKCDPNLTDTAPKG